jgi:hypothetical protein
LGRQARPGGTERRACKGRTGLTGLTELTEQLGLRGHEELLDPPAPTGFSEPMALPVLAGLSGL